MKSIRNCLLLLLMLCQILFVFTGCTDKVTQAVVEMPEFDERLELTVWVTQGSDYKKAAKVKNNVVEQWLIDKTNVSIKNAYGNGGGQWESVLSRLTAGDEFPELVACGGGQGPVHFGKIAEVDKIWELTPQMLKTYAPDIWEKVPNEMWERIKIDGKIYGIPYNFPVSGGEDYTEDLTEEQIKGLNNSPISVGTDLWIRDDILKMLYPETRSWDELLSLMKEKDEPIGDDIYDVPIESSEDLISLFKRIKALNLKAGENEVYAFGYSSTDCWVPFAQLGAQMSGYVGRNYFTTWDTEKQEIVVPLLGNIVKETALIQNRLVREKVFDPESLVITQEQFKDKVLNGEYAVAVLTYAGHPPEINNELAKRGKTFRYRPLYTNIPPISGYGPVSTPISWGSAVGILKSVPEEKLPQVLNWMNIQFTDEWEEVRYWGPEEAGLYKENPDGTREFYNEELNKKYMLNERTTIKEEDCYGLGGNAGLFSMSFMTYSKYRPKEFNNIKAPVLVPTSGGRLSDDSPLRREVKKAPPFEAWSAEYANLETVSEFWSSRSHWEDNFKMTLASRSDEEFEQRWNEAVENLKSITDIDRMTREMTEIARGLMEKIEQQAEYGGN